MRYKPPLQPAHRVVKNSYRLRTSLMTCPTIKGRLFSFMAFKTEAHVKGNLVEPINMLDLTMTLLTGYFFVDVPEVREINMVRFVINPQPGNPLPLVVVLFQFHDFIMERDNMIVTPQTLLGGGNSSIDTPLPVRMAVETINLLVSHMQSMRKGNWLLEGRAEHGSVKREFMAI